MKLTDILNIACFAVLCVFSHAIYLVMQNPDMNITTVSRYNGCYIAGMMVGSIFTLGLMWARERWLIPLAVQYGGFWACEECPKKEKVFGMTIEDVSRLMKECNDYQTTGDIDEPQHNKSE